MRIRIDDDFDNDLEAEYRSIDNDSIVGNGALSKDNIPIVDVKAKDVDKEKKDEEESNTKVKKEESNKYNFNNGFSIQIQGATLLNDYDIENSNDIPEPIKEDTVIKHRNNGGIRENGKAGLRNNKKINEKEEYKFNNEHHVKGKITVGVRLGDRKGKAISEARINLYALNGLSPKLVSSKLTDINGIVVFDGLAEGSYRVIEIINRKYFEKPTYIQWNEVTINKDLKEERIIVINRIKKHSK